MAVYTKTIEELIAHFKKMPGIGSKTAERLAFYILKLTKEEAASFASTILKVKEKVTHCKLCGNLSEQSLCHICSDPRRDRSIVCVVEEPKDIIAIEKSNQFKGLYHVLFGAISPLEGIGPEEIRVKELLGRVKEGEIKEVIIATDSDAEGETTALYLAKELKDFKIRITRIAYGIPVGSNLEYVDQATLVKALEGRRIIK